MRHSTLTLQRRRPLPPLLVPALLAGGAVAAAGWWSGAAAVLIVGVPIIGSLAFGLATRRGLIVAAVLLVFGMSQIPASATAVPWADLGLLGALVTTGIVMGKRAESRSPRPAILSAGEGRWMSVTVEAGCPPESAGIVSPRPVPPLDDPERRSLHRRKNGRRSMAMMAD